MAEQLTTRYSGCRLEESSTSLEESSRRTESSTQCDDELLANMSAMIDALQLKLSLLEARSDDQLEQQQTQNNSTECIDYVKSLQSSAGVCQTDQTAADAAPPSPHDNDSELETTEMSAETILMNSADTNAKTVDSESEYQQELTVGDLRKDHLARTSERSTHNVRYYFLQES